MKTIAGIFGVVIISLFSFSVSEAAPTLSASSTQATYPGTSIPYLTISSGSGKTSYISGAINDPTDPAYLYGIYFTCSASDVTFTVTSSKSSVVPVNNVSVNKNADTYIVKINPAGVGYTDLKITAKNGSGTSSAYTIKYAASAASSNPSQTIFPTYISDASGAVAVDDDYMFVADDELNFLHLYSRNGSGKDLYSKDFTSSIGASEECDLEGAALSVKYNQGKRIYWIGSLGNSKKGNLKPDRDKAFATDISGTGAGSTLSVKSYSNKMRSSLISWGDNCGWNFTKSAAEGMIPKLLEGFNVEGLAIAQGGDTAYIGFRAPCVPVKSTTPNSSNRKYAVIAPVINFETIFNGSGSVSTTPNISEPILFDFGGLGIRSIESVGQNKYLIIAGLYTGGGTPELYLWDGKTPTNPGSNPITTSSDYSKLIKLDIPGLSELAQVSSGDAEGHPEAMIAKIEGDILKIQLLSDNGTVDFYNDGIEAKSLSYNQYKKFRTDKFEYPLNTTKINTNSIKKSGLAAYSSGESIYIIGLKENSQIKVFHITGETVFETTCKSSSYNLTLKPGLYLIQYVYNGKSDCIKILH